MHKTFSVFFLIICSLFGFSQQKSKVEIPVKNIENLRNDPVSRFEENNGQFHKNVKFRTELTNGYVYLEDAGLTYHFFNGKQLHEAFHHRFEETINIDNYAFKAKFINANKNSIITKSGVSEYYRSYFIGNDASKWVNKANFFNSIQFQNIYNGIDLNYGSFEDHLKYDFIVHPGANHNDIKINFEGQEKIRKNNDGSIEIISPLGIIKEFKPFAYQVINGIQVEVPCAFELYENTISFIIGNSYNTNADLIIDPTLIASTLTGSTVDNWGFTAANSPNGNIYTAGIVTGAGYPTTPGAFQTTIQNTTTATGNLGVPCDISISIFNSTGTALLASTYLGGANHETPHSIAVLNNGDLYLLGKTESSNFPTTIGCFDNSFNGGGEDIIVCQLNSALTNLMSSTFVGGSGLDGANVTSNPTGVTNTSFTYGDCHRGSIVLDGAGNVYIASSSQSSNFPFTAGCFDNTLGGSQDAVVFKMNGALTAMSYATYLGGSDFDAGIGIELDVSNNVYVVGATTSTNFPTTVGVINPNPPGGVLDGFLTRLNTTGSALLASTYLGTLNKDAAFFVDLNPTGDVYVFGLSEGGTYPVVSATYSVANTCQFIHKLSSGLNNTIFSTVFGAGSINANISPTAFRVDSCGNIALGGWGRAFNGGSTTGMQTTTGAYQTTTDGQDFYLLAMEDNALSLKYATFFGRNGGLLDHVDGGTSTWDRKGIVYQSVCASCLGNATGFPTTPGAYSSTNNSSNCNNAVFKFDLGIFKPSAAAIAGSSNGCNNVPVTFTNNSSNATSYLWFFGDGATSTATTINVAHTYTNTGTYTVSLVASNSVTCIKKDSVVTIITITQPTVNLNVNPISGVLCQGFSGTLTANGAVTYTWNPGAFNTTSIVVTPTASTIYTIIGTSALGCNDTKTVNITSNINPTITVSASSTTLCSGAVVTLSASGATSYNWNPGNLSGSVVTTTIGATTVFTVVGTLASGCIDTKTITLFLNNCPTAVNDGLATIINTSVVSSAAPNDFGVTGGTFVITNQPTNGTVTINPSTGQFTFTPQTGFTGVTTATYQLCNGSPVVCSNATITFTVYPFLVAIPDLITTTPSVSSTGTLLANDIGITVGGMFAVNITQPSAATGTFVLNSSTGQYTFFPNPSFTGTAQTTYTVCNISVNPVVCSNTIITIIVGNNAFALPDVGATIINTPLTGTVATNDGGAEVGLSPIFTYNQPTAGTGTIVMDPSTGQYTFTPATGFTGTTIVTYTLCNALSPPCSTTTIIFTVFPILVANPDVIITTPSVTATGTLLINDLGILSSGIYTVSITQPPITTGSITINATTGQYSFFPNPSFIGTVQTTYTVCNLSVNPILCSTSTITILVGNSPAALPDVGATIINTSVSGTVAINDGGAEAALNPIFTSGQPSAGTGTIVMDPSTGQYTFTPATGFTGTTIVTYTLCNLLSPPCSVTSLTISVFPNLVAVQDTIITTPSVSSTGTLLPNDLGVVSGGVYSVTITQPSSSTGTILVNPTTGEYTFLPNAGFTGSVQTTYTVCQYVPPSMLPLQCSSATITIIVGEKIIGCAKAVSTPTYNPDNTISVNYKIIIKNFGPTALTNISLADDLSLTFPTPTTFTIVSPPTIITALGTQLVLDPSYTGTGTNTLITSALSSSLAVGRTDTLLFGVTISPNGFFGPISNSALISAFDGITIIGDTSTNGFNPDPDGDGVTFNNSIPTTFTITSVKIGIAKMASKPRNDGNDNFNVTFKFTIKNFGFAPIYNVQVSDNLNITFPSPSSYTILAPPVSTNGILLPNLSFNGGSDNLLISNNSTLLVGQTDTIILKVKYTSNGITSFSNTANASASSLPIGGINSSDVSTNGTNPDLNGNNNPNDIGEDELTIFKSEEGFNIPQGFSPNADGVNDVFVIRGIEAYPDNELIIFNRWGNKVYKVKGYNNTWNGKVTEGVTFGNDDLPEGTYFYILDLNNGEKAYKGYIYINRVVK